MTFTLATLSLLWLILYMILILSFDCGQVYWTSRIFNLFRLCLFWHVCNWQWHLFLSVINSAFEFYLIINLVCNYLIWRALDPSQFSTIFTGEWALLITMSRLLVSQAKNWVRHRKWWKSSSWKGKVHSREIGMGLSRQVARAPMAECQHPVFSLVCRVPHLSWVWDFLIGTCDWKGELCHFS